MVLVSAGRHSVPMPHLEQLICTSRWRFLSLAASASTVTVLPSFISRLLIAVNGFGARFFCDTRLPVPLLVLERTPYYLFGGCFGLAALELQFKIRGRGDRCYSRSRLPASRNSWAKQYRLLRAVAFELMEARNLKQ